MRRFIFFWFLAVGLISVIGAVWIGRSMKLASAGVYESDVVNDTAETVSHALDSGGGFAPHHIERRTHPKGEPRFFLVDPHLNEVSRGTAAGIDSARPSHPWAPTQVHF